jgi:hypothetical protein
MPLSEAVRITQPPMNASALTGQRNSFFNRARPLLLKEQLPIIRGMGSIIEAGLKGIFAGLERAAASAERISRGFVTEEEGEPVRSMIELKSAERQVQASAKIIRVGDDLQQSIIDLLA